MKPSFVLPLEIWNHAARALWRSRPRSGTNCRLLELADGTMVSPDAGTQWRHPWFTSPRWNGKDWVATVAPGFVNEWDPLVPGYGDLIDGPEMVLSSFRSLPGEGDPLPAFFKALGVLDFFDGYTVSEFGVALKTPPTPTQPPRALVAMDFFVAVARATYQGQATEIDASGTSGVVVDYSVAFDTANLDRLGLRPRLLQAAKYPAVRVPTLAERLMGQYQDEGEDRILVSTVYLLSPPDQPNGPPDARWTPFVRHNLFWNLAHAARNIPPPKPAEPIRLFTGLLGGLGDLIANQTLSGINEYADTVNNAVNTTNNAGVFWTA